MLTPSLVRTLLAPKLVGQCIYTVESRNNGSQRTNNFIHFRRISANIGIKEKFTQGTVKLPVIGGFPLFLDLLLRDSTVCPIFSVPITA